VESITGNRWARQAGVGAFIGFFAGLLYGAGPGWLLGVTLLGAVLGLTAEVIDRRVVNAGGHVTNTWGTTAKVIAIFGAICLLLVVILIFWMGR
jgi:hypothetical protein